MSEQNAKQYVSFDSTRPIDVIPIGRATVDLNPVDYNRTLEESTTFKNMWEVRLPTLQLDLQDSAKRLDLSAWFPMIVLETM